MHDDESLFRLFGAGEEVRRSKEYYIDNSVRPLFWGAATLVLQKTISGSCYFVEANGERKKVGPNQAMLFTHRENTSYGFPKGTSGECFVRFLNFSDRLGVIEPFLQIRAQFGSVVSMPAGSEVDQLFNQVFVGFNDHSIPDRWHEVELVFRMLIALLKEQSVATLATDPIGKAHAYMMDKFRSYINLKDVANHCEVSREHLCRMYRERYGVSPALFLRDLRLKYGHTLLSSTTMPVEDIAVGCGYVHANAFARAYRKKYDCSPTDTRIAQPSQVVGS